MKKIAMLIMTMVMVMNLAACGEKDIRDDFEDKKVIFTFSNTEHVCHYDRHAQPPYLMTVKLEDGHSFGEDDLWYIISEIEALGCHYVDTENSDLSDAEVSELIIQVTGYPDDRLYMKRLSEYEPK